MVHQVRLEVQEAPSPFVVGASYHSHLSLEEAAQIDLQVLPEVAFQSPSQAFPFRVTPFQVAGRAAGREASPCAPGMLARFPGIASTKGQTYVLTALVDL